MRIRRPLIAAAIVAAGVVVPASQVAQAGPVSPNDVRISNMGNTSVVRSRVAYSATSNRYLVVWEGDDDNNGVFEIYGRLVDAATGTAFGSEFVIGDMGVGAGANATDPSVAWDSTHDEFVVAFVGDLTSEVLPSVANANEIYAQRVSATGAGLLGPRQRVSDMGSSDASTSFDAFEPDIAYSASTDRLLVVWRGDDDTAPLVNGEDEVFGQLLIGGTLAEAGVDQRISFMGPDGDLDYSANEPAVAADGGGGGFLVTWWGNDGALDDFDVWGQRTDSGGTPTGGEIQISTSTAGDTADESYRPDVVFNGSEYVVVWEGDVGSSNEFEVFGRRVGTNGVPMFSASQLSSAGVSLNDDTVVATPAISYSSTLNQVFVVWKADDTDFGGVIDNDVEVIGQRFTPTLSSIEGPYRISEANPDGSTNPSVQTPDVAAGDESNGAALAVWAGEDTDHAGNPTAVGENEVWAQRVAVRTDLQVTAEIISADNPAAGDGISMTVTYRNNGPAEVHDVIVNVPLPAGFAMPFYIGGTEIGGDPASRGVGSLFSGESGVITISGVAQGANGSTIPVTASITTGTVIDEQPTANSTSTVTYTIDNPPTVTMNQAGGQMDPTNATPINFTAVFSEPVTGFDGADITFTGSTAPGTPSALVTGSGPTYNVAVSGMTGPGTVVASIPSATVADVSGGKPNFASTSTDNSVLFDNVAPTVTINQAAAQPDPTNVSPIVFDVLFSEPVTGFTNADVSFTGSTVGGTLVANVTGTGPGYTVSVTGMTGTGTVVASINAAAGTDPATNASGASTSTDNSVTYDATPPTVTVDQGALQADPTAGLPVSFDVVFSESVTGFDGFDVNFTGSTAPGTFSVLVSGSGSTYTVDVSGATGDGVIVASVGAGAASDAVGNASLASTSTDNSVLYDASPPSVTINKAATQPDPTNASPITFDVVFTESVTGFDAADVSFTGSTVGGSLLAAVSGSGATYTVSVSGMSGTGDVVASIPAGAASDAVSNASLASTSTDNTVAFDGDIPTVTINQAAGQADPTNASPITFDVVFTESVTGFDASDISFTGSTVGGSLVANVSGTGPGYTVSVTGMTGTGTVVASVSAGASVDGASNASAASTSIDNSVTYDGVAPTVTIEQAFGQADPTNVSPITFTVTFSEPVLGFVAEDVVLSGSGSAGAAAAISGSGPAYTVTVTGMINGTVVAAIGAGAAADPAGNSAPVSTSIDNSVTYDTVVPTVTIDQAGSQVDPTDTASVAFTVQFSEPVSGFGTADIDLSTSTATGTLVAGVSGSGASYTVTVTGMTGTGTVVASIGAGAASDAATNASTVSTSTDNSVLYDVTAPTVTINQAAGQADPTNDTSIDFAVVFSESVSGFDGSDVSFSGSTAPGTLAASVTGSGTTYNVAVTGMTGGGTVVASIGAGAASDAATNPSAASTSTDNSVTFDNTLPSVTIDQAAGQPDPTNGTSVEFTVVFSEAVTDFDDAGDVVLDLIGTTGTASISGTGTTYTVTLSGVSGNGTIAANVVSAAAVDAGGNPSSASTSTDNTVAVDTDAPSVSIDRSAGQPDPTNLSPVVFDVVFSESVTGFGAEAGDVVVATTGTLNYTTAVVSGSGSSYTVTVDGLTGDGDVTATVPAAAAVDSSTNGNGPSTSTDNTVTFDDVAPTVTLDQSASQADPTAGPAVSFDVHFSEPVAGFGPADVMVSGPPAGSASISVSGAGADYLIAVGPVNGTGVVTADVAVGAAADAAGNSSAASTSTDNEITVDAVGPAVTIEQAASQADPAEAEASIEFTVVFSEPVAGFTAEDVTVGGTAGATAASVTGSGASYEVAVTGMTQEGTVTASVVAGAVADELGNLSTPSTSVDNSVTLADLGDPVAPDEPGPTSVVEEGTATFSITPDSLVDGSHVVGVSPTSAGGGTVVLNADGTVTYKSAPGFEGQDSFTYTVCDNDLPTPTCATGTVTLDVADEGDPVANPDTINVLPGGRISVNVTANDIMIDEAKITKVFIGDTSNAVVLATGQSTVRATTVQGTVELAADGTITYTAAAGFVGTETFGYVICDDDLPVATCSQTTVTATLVELPATGGSLRLVPLAAALLAIGLAVAGCSRRRVRRRRPA